MDLFSILTCWTLVSRMPSYSTLTCMSVLSGYVFTVIFYRTYFGDSFYELLIHLCIVLSSGSGKLQSTYAGESL